MWIAASAALVAIGAPAGAQRPLPEITIVSGTLVHHPLTDSLFHIDSLWLRVASDTEFHRWLSKGIDRKVTILLTADAGRFEDVKGVRIVHGTLVHQMAPGEQLPTHVLFLTDPSSTVASAVTLQTTDLAIANRFDVYDGVEVNLVISIK